MLLSISIKDLDQAGEKTRKNQKLGTMVAVEDFRRNKLREGQRPDAGDDVEQNGGLEEMEQTIDGNHDLLLGVNN
ncbi:hypothetical protein F2Q69_00045117 [Brassica cretica]|uniref:Uncharacterized protein n=1 Tax=Brassica cretica TaxID=69181 RepID=A0A8S9N7U3_BRACR|nr:hypothetical protein F2Q69_00045117 [Brassica cretica]